MTLQTDNNVMGTLQKHYKLITLQTANINNRTLIIEEVRKTWVSHELKVL